MDISNYYEILGIPHTASKEEIRRAYHSLARKYHPDVAGSEQRYMFDSILQAYGVLSDTSKREEYDRKNSHRFSTTKEQSDASAENSVKNNDEKNNQQSTASRTDAKVSDNDTAVSDKLATDEESINTQDPSSKQTKGWGRFVSGIKQTAQEITKPHSSSKLSANDLLGKRVYKFTIDALEAIRGTKREIALNEGGETVKADVIIPTGVLNGKTHHLALVPQDPEQFAPERIEATVTILPTQFLEINQLDVTLHLPVTISEAVNGVKVELPTAQANVKVSIPPITSARKPLRVKDHGIASLTSDKIGDFLIIPFIVPPDRASVAMEQALQACDAHYSVDVRSELPKSFK